MAESYHVKATYSGPLLFLASGQWTHVLASLRDRLPLRNLHWKSAARPSIRSVQELEIDLVSLDGVRDEPSSQIPATVLERPLINIFFVTCEDADTYKNSARKQIRDWHTLVTQRKNQEWMIVLVIRPDHQATTNRLFQRGTILDKIRADFNVAKRDRCVQLAWSLGSDDPAAWTDFVSKLKEGIISSFDSNIIQREEEVKRSEVQRQMPGWNFCTFFILKESMATSFEGMNLIDDAQIQYDELEASFFQVLKEKNLSWFGQLGGTAPNDDSAPLLSVNKKPYRDLILSNTITVFDFRSYLLARQCSLLARQGKIAEAATKAERFVTGFARTLRENQHSLSEFFLESWMYSSAFNVVDQCEAWSGASALEAQAISSFQAIKGELLELARSQLDKIGIRKGYLPASPPFTVSLDTVPLPSPTSSTLSTSTPASSSSGPKISTPELLEALNSRDAFDRLYVTTTNKAIQTYGSCERRRFALKLHASLAALDHHRDRYPSAHAVFTSLPSHYVNQRWSSLEGFVLTKSMESNTPSSSESPVLDNEWITQVLAFLKALILHDGKGVPTVADADAEEPTEFAGINGREKLDFVAGLVRDLRKAADNLDQDYAVQSFPAFEVKLQGTEASLRLDEDGSSLSVDLNNHLPADVSIDEVIITLKGGVDDERLAFTSSGEGPINLKPGCTPLQLTYSIPSSGLFVLDKVVVRLGMIQFQYSQTPSPSRLQHKAEKGSPLEIKKQQIKHRLVRIPHDDAALDAHLSFPRDVTLDGIPHLTLKLMTGRNHLADAILSLRNPGDDVSFTMQDAELSEGAGDSTVEFADTSIKIQNVPPKSSLTFNVPYAGARLDSIKVRVQVDYSTQASPETRRRITRVQSVDTALPLAVNVQDYFRGQKLFSRFAIRCAGGQRLYLLDALLKSRSQSSSMRISRCRKQSRSAEVILPSRPVYHLFRLEPEAATSRPDNENLVLVLTYRTLEEELEARVTRSLQGAVAGNSLTGDHAWLRSAITQAVHANDGWANLGENHVEDELQKGLLERVASDNTLPEDEKETLTKVIPQVVHAFCQSPEEDEPQKHNQWRTLSIPLDLPFLNILNAARITIPAASKESVYAGQPVQATVCISTSFHWGHAAPENGYLLRFEVNTDVGGSWLISGPKRGDYLAHHDSKYETQITLVPLRHGPLHLPKVSVTPVLEAHDHYDQEPPSCETHQLHIVERITVLPRSARSTYVVAL